MYLFSGDKSFYKEDITVKGFASSSTRKVHFGLGKLAVVDSLKVIWNDGTQTLKNGININSQITVTKENTTKAKFISEPKPVYNTFDFVHKEDPYLDYERDALKFAAGVLNINFKQNKKWTDGGWMNGLGDPLIDKPPGASLFVA